MLGPLPVWAWGLAVAVLGGSFAYGRKHGSGSVTPFDTSLNQPADLSSYAGVSPGGGSSGVGYVGSPITNPGGTTGGGSGGTTGGGGSTTTTAYPPGIRPGGPTPTIAPGANNLGLGQR